LRLGLIEGRHDRLERLLELSELSQALGELADPLVDRG
jgi:hypothetical protein